MYSNFTSGGRTSGGGGGSNQQQRKRRLSSTTSATSGDNADSSSGSSSESESESSTSQSTVKSKKATYSTTDDATSAGENPTPDETLSKYSDIALRMMSKMGYKKGRGLGKNETGRTEIIEASNQRGRRGLGLRLQGLDGKTNSTWEEDEEVMIKQDPQWIPTNTSPAPALDDMYQWTNMSARKETIDDEFQFCEAEILKGVLASKSVFDHLGHSEFLRARTRANPYETIRGAIFQNRAAMKMAEMDASFDDMFTSHHDFDEKNPSSLLYFADICAGPGGFSEYVLWRRKWRSKGFGFTLKAEGANDFKLDDFKAGTPESFDCHYGVKGYDGDGDIFREDNLREFRSYVMQNTDNKGVHFVMADGGFSVEGNENIQEILSKQLYLCQFICALSILREGGHFVCKLFDLFTPFSIGLVYLMYRAFEKVCIFKPVTSRPANSERYIVCQKYRKDVSSIHDYMFELNCKINRLKGSNIDIGEVVPVDIIKDDEPFFQYIYNSNNEIGARQILGLKKLATYVQNTNLVGANQAEVRKQCLEAWKVPTAARSNPSNRDPDNQFEKIINYSSAKMLSTRPKPLSQDILSAMKSIHDYKWTFSGGERFYLFSLGRYSIYQWNPAKNSAPTFKRVDNMNFELPRHTILDVEFVYELKGDGRGQRKVMGVHIIDALQLGDDYIGDKPMSDRLKIIRNFIKALSKPCRSDIIKLRVKDYHPLTELNDCLESLEEKTMKPRMERRLACIFNDQKYFVPNGVYMIRRVKDPWHLQYSKSSKRFYFYNRKTNESVFEPAKSSIADAKYCAESRVQWLWADGTGLSNWSALNSSISRKTFVDFIESKN
ncbi:cap-specific mRNA (nucleoside-2'-O-)-methyltransferase 1-like [Clytia hemisphaerica]|uniref:Cap-specific mRNA (nucleoside-2'-O-)-methyltransferase 1 n=1 Tax=Clytia hemisphaerica TaxID=252671 RepID=A0A7M5WVK1_9CNID